VIDACILGCLLLVPAVMGGRHPWAHLILVALAVAMLVAWAVRVSLRRDATLRLSPGLLLFSGGLLLLIVQLAPLPAPLLAWFMPESGEMLPVWGPKAGTEIGLGDWNTITLAPAETRGALVIFLAYGCVFFVAVQHTRRLEDVERLVRWCAVAATLMAAFGLLQLATSNGKFFWFYEHPFSHTHDVAKGGFVNRNHFAQFLALGIGPLLWWMQDALGRLRRPPGRTGRTAAVPSPATAAAPWLIGGAIGIVLLGGLLSLSRGGIAAIFLAGAVCCVPLARRKALPGTLAVALLLGGLAVPAGLALSGYDLLDQRVDDLAAGSIERLDAGSGRRTVWTALATAIPQYARLGAGIGTHGELHQRYLTVPASPSVEFTHAENSYLQLAFEAGLPGLALALAGIGLCAAWCLSGWRSGATRVALLAPALLASLAAVAAHALVDVVWYAPGCVVLLIVQAACAYRLRVIGCKAHGRFEQRVPLTRPMAVGAVALALAAGVWMLSNRVGPAVAAGAWDRFQLAYGNWHVRWREIDEAELRESPETQSRLIAAQKRMIGCLEDVVRWHPEHGRARVELTEGYLRLFGLTQLGNENPMSLRNIRDAAVQSRFTTREALQAWLQVAVGEHTQYLDEAAGHAEAAVRTCPLLARSYLHLAELAFLEPGREHAPAALVEQAVRLRPMDGEVLYSAAIEAWLAGDGDRWLELARRAFHCGPVYQRRIIHDLVAHAHAGQLSATIDLVVRHFDADIAGLRTLEAAASQHGTAEQLAPLRRYYAETASAAARGASRGQAARYWLEAQRMYARLDEHELALACAREAAQRDPNSFDVQYALAMRLLDQSEFVEAERILYWCLQRRPNDASLENRWKLALKHKLDNPHHAGARKDGVMR
jgi:O-antigen ligase/tetratricopeptide (TPR) repeat protein